MITGSINEVTRTRCSNVVFSGKPDSSRERRVAWVKARVAMVKKFMMVCVYDEEFVSLTIIDATIASYGRKLIYEKVILRTV